MDLGIIRLGARLRRSAGISAQVVVSSAEAQYKIGLSK